MPGEFTDRIDGATWGRAREGCMEQVAFLTQEWPEQPQATWEELTQVRRILELEKLEVY
jgi:hypothetical protein